MKFWRRDVAHPFTREDREAQLVDFELLCASLATLYADNGDTHTASLLNERSVRAAELLSVGWTNDDLSELGGQFPDGGWWLNPKALDYNAPREAWQDEVARLYPLAEAVAVDLRAVATMYRRR